MTTNTPEREARPDEVHQQPGQPYPAYQYRAQQQQAQTRQPDIAEIGDKVGAHA